MDKQPYTHPSDGPVETAWEVQPFKPGDSHIKYSFRFKRELVEDSPNAGDILNEMWNIANLLLTKNRAYSSSFCSPLGVFSKLSPVEAINARMDDKLARIKQAKDFSEDTELDLVGYLILKRIAIQAGQPPKTALPETCSHESQYGKCIRPLGHLGDHRYKFHWDDAKPFRPSVEEVRAIKDPLPRVCGTCAEYLNPERESHWVHEGKIHCARCYPKVNWKWDERKDSISEKTRPEQPASESAPPV